jgi:hypothetical protein
MSDVGKFSRKLLKYLENFRIAGKAKLSRIILLKNQKTKYKQKLNQ